MEVKITPTYSTDLGDVYSGNCIDIMPTLEEKADVIFADPPFNLSKTYNSKISDSLSEEEYLKFQEKWITEAALKLKDGGSFFLYNIPKWNIEAAHFMKTIGLEFRHWIAVDMTLGLPIKGRLYPSHYSLLYFTKGKPNTFTPPRTPIESCRHCGGDIKDYGGHRNKLNPDGISLKDIWTDIGKVSGKKSRSANELPTKLIERVLQISTKEGDLLLDPFAGSGTSLIVAGKMNRRFIGIEMDDCTDIINRFKSLKEAA